MSQLLTFVIIPALLEGIGCEQILKGSGYADGHGDQQTAYASVTDKTHNTGGGHQGPQDLSHVAQNGIGPMQCHHLRKKKGLPRDTFSDSPLILPFI
jgi:hypothetical protein